MSPSAGILRPRRGATSPAAEQPRTLLGVGRLRLSAAAYRTVTFLALCALCIIIVSGAAVRLSGSGLGCTDWPNCTEGQLVAPLEFHPMIEFVNRVFTGAVSLAVIAAVLGSLVREPKRRDLTVLSLGLVAGVIGQIVLGGLTVLAGLSPPFVMGHFLLSALLVWNAVVLHHRAGQPDTAPVPVVPESVRHFGRVMVGLAGLVLVTGTVVTSTGPHGGDETAPRFGFDITEVARIHSVTVWTFLVVTLVCLAALHRAGGGPLGVERRGRMLVLGIVAQGGLGYLQYALSVPPLLVGLHIAGSVAVWILVLRFHLGLWTRPLESAGPAVAGEGVDSVAPDPALLDG